MDNVLESPYSIDMHQQKKPGKKTHFRLEYVNGVNFVLCLMWKGTFFFSFFILVEACAGDVPSTRDHLKILNSFVVALL